MVVRGRLAKVTEVPYTFQPRQAGESKASWREGVRAGKLIVGQWFATFSSQYGNSARVSANASGISSVTGDDLATRTGYGLQQMFGLSPMFAVLLAAALILAWRRRGP